MTDECKCDEIDPETHPDWMKGMCECCYDQWAEAMRNRYSA